MGATRDGSVPDPDTPAYAFLRKGKGGAVDATRYFLRGEVDVSNADESLAFIRASACLHSDNVTIDCMDLLFIDAAGLGAIVALNNELLVQGRVLQLVHASPFFVRILDICGLTELLAGNSSARSDRRAGYQRSDSG